LVTALSRLLTPLKLASSGVDVVLSALGLACGGAVAAGAAVD